MVAGCNPERAGQGGCRERLTIHHGHRARAIARDLHSPHPWGQLGNVVLSLLPIFAILYGRFLGPIQEALEGDYGFDVPAQPAQNQPLREKSLAGVGGVRSLTGSLTRLSGLGGQLLAHQYRQLGDVGLRFLANLLGDLPGFIDEVLKGAQGVRIALEPAQGLTHGEEDLRTGKAFVGLLELFQGLVELFLVQAFIALSEQGARSCLGRIVLGLRKR